MGAGAGALAALCMGHSGWKEVSDCFLDTCYREHDLQEVNCRYLWEEGAAQRRAHQSGSSLPRTNP
jgi:hypothetical protein